MKLEVRQLAGRRAQKNLFENLHFTLQPSELLLVEGANGSGKSSLLRILSGLATPFAGDVYWNGMSIQHCLPEYWQCLHYMGHTNGIKQGLSVSENLQLAQHLSLQPQKNTHEILQALDLWQDRETIARFLSAGQKRRIALAKLFLYPKKIWVLDEPLTALDHQTQAVFLTQLKQHLYHGGITVMSSHHPVSLTGVSILPLRLSL